MKPGQTHKNRPGRHFLSIIRFERITSRPPQWATQTCQTQMSNLPHAAWIWKLFFHAGPTHRTTFCPVWFAFPYKKNTLYVWRGKKKSKHFRLQILQQYFSPLKSVALQPVCVSSFVHGELRRGCSVRAVNHAPCAVKFGSAGGRRAEMSIKARKAEIFRLDALPGLALSSSRSVSDISGFHSALSSVTVEPLCRHLMDTRGTAAPNPNPSSLFIFFWHFWY